MHSEQLRFQTMKKNMEILQNKTQGELQQQHGDNLYLRKELDEQIRVNKKFHEEMEQFYWNHEEEVELRRSINVKLNILHSINNNLKHKYDQAKLEIYNMEQDVAKYKEEATRNQQKCLELGVEDVQNK